MRDHQWYDIDSGRMLRGRGGRMEFIYDPKQRRSIPRIVDHEELVTENSYDDILDWVKQQNLTVLHEAPKLYLTIEVTPSEWALLEDTLYRKNIAYDYDERELRKESQTEETKWRNSISRLQTRLAH